MESGDDPDVPDSQRKKKRYHRHTARQISELERMFKECPHPDEKQRNQLSRDLGLQPRQIKFWFQNRRTQMKAQTERNDNCLLRSENDKIRCENIAIREALKNIVCPTCGPPSGEDGYFDEQKLRMENARLKEELDRISSIAAKYIGRPISQLPHVHPIHASSLDLSMGSFGGYEMGVGPSLDLDLLPGNGACDLPSLPFLSMGITDMDKSLMAKFSSNAMDELLILMQTNEPLWMKSAVDGRDVLNLESYERTFPTRVNHMKNPNIRTEASRSSSVVIMDGVSLVDMFMNSSKWLELFPTIVSKARIIEVLVPGIAGSRSGSLQLMYEEIQILSPFVAAREFYFLRYCLQIEPGSWAIADVSYDLTRENLFITNSRRLPSGCLIQDMPNGYSKVTWVDHVEVEEKSPTHRFYRDLINSGLAFGAERWLATLQRMCDRFACSLGTETSTRDLGGAIPSPEGRRSMMKLAQRMVTSFCGGISASTNEKWTSLSGLNDLGVRVKIQKGTDPGQHNGVVLCASTTIWLPISSETVFNFIKDERNRAQWDVLLNGDPVQEVAHIANGAHTGNCISVLRAFNANHNNMLLQESCTDSSGSLVVYSSVELSGISLAMSGEDTSYIPLTPSGFIISPDGQPDQGNGASTSSGTRSTGGSLITVAYQMVVSSFPAATLSMDSVNTVNNLIGTTVQRIKAALNCPGS